MAPSGPASTPPAPPTTPVRTQDEETARRERLNAIEARRRERNKPSLLEETPRVTDNRNLEDDDQHLNFVDPLPDPTDPNRKETQEPVNSKRQIKNIFEHHRKLEEEQRQKAKAKAKVAPPPSTKTPPGKFKNYDDEIFRGIRTGRTPLPPSPESIGKITKEPDELDWENTVIKEFVRTGIPAPAAKALAIVIAITPLGTAFDVGQNLFNAGNALARGDIKSGLGYLGSAGMSVAKVGQVADLLSKHGAKVADALSKALPEIASSYVARDLAKQGLAGQATKETLEKAFKNGLKVREAGVYGVISAHAKNSVNSALRSVVGKSGKAALSVMTPAQKSKVREITKTATARKAASVMGHFSQEVQDRLVEKALNEVLGPSQKSAD